eukprot:CAMPEP_0201610760 /NCGR_PEP_ID=MMETSP0492-20130828/17803_1 /ASSEMBLY_ACC=CAM_ASM_000837 /TAXON_ID=420259 /ORGANISM="Thalassiosira gravida, Strain GMp14c1" /LENGTH=66 /DNA_ID=CAMNT_0048076687 /DNA_START=61 /DNA_END=258 /DNA_ORIENTATION=+
MDEILSAVSDMTLNTNASNEGTESCSLVDCSNSTLSTTSSSSYTSDSISINATDDTSSSIRLVTIP